MLCGLPAGFVSPVAEVSSASTERPARNGTVACKGALRNRASLQEMPILPGTCSPQAYQQFNGLKLSGNS